MTKSIQAPALISLLLFGMMPFAYAQPDLSRWQVGVSAGMFIYQGDLTLANLKGDDAKYNDPDWRQQRNFNFTSPVTEISELVVWNVFKNNSNEVGKRFSPYLFAGAGISFIKVKHDYSSFNAEYFGDGSDLPSRLAEDIATNTPRKIFVLPAGIGVEYYLSPKIALTAETNFRYTFTDYLDGFSQAANPEKKDFYHSHTIGLVYKFGTKNGLGCPAMKY